MYANSHSASSHAIPQGHTSSTAYATALSYGTTSSLALVPTQTPTPPLLSPVQVPSGCYPIELVQFWRDEFKRGQPFPLHWALFIRTALCGVQGIGTMEARSRRLTTGTLTPRGNFYELVGTPDTYTAQFLPNVTFEPDMLADWRGTHVIGWVNPGRLPMFEAIVREVPVWRHRSDWRSQQWAYEVVRLVGEGYQGMFTEVVTFGVLQRHMGKLLDAWESGDI